MESIADRIRATRQSFNVEPPQKNSQLIASPEVKQSNSQALTNTIEIQNKSTVQSAQMKNFAEKIKSIRENISSDSQSQGSQSSSLDHPFAISRLSHPKIAGFKSDESPQKVSQKPVRMKM